MKEERRKRKKARSLSFSLRHIIMPRKKRGSCSSSSPRGMSLEPGEIDPSKLSASGSSGSGVGAGADDFIQDKPSIASIFGVSDDFAADAAAAAAATLRASTVTTTMKTLSRQSKQKTGDSRSLSSSLSSTVDKLHSLQQRSQLMTAFPTPEVKIKKRKISGVAPANDGSEFLDEATSGRTGRTRRQSDAGGQSSEDCIDDDSVGAADDPLRQPPADFKVQRGTDGSPAPVSRGRGRPRGSRGRPRGSGRGGATVAGRGELASKDGGEEVVISKRGGPGRGRGRGRGRAGAVVGERGGGLTDAGEGCVQRVVEGGDECESTALTTALTPNKSATAGPMLDTSFSSDSSISPEKSNVTTTTIKSVKKEKKKFSPQKLPPQQPIITSKRKEFMDCIHSEKKMVKKIKTSASPEKIKIKAPPRAAAPEAASEDDTVSRGSKTMTTTASIKKVHDDSRKASAVLDVVASASNDFNSDDDEKTKDAIDDAESTKDAVLSSSSTPQRKKHFSASSSTMDGQNPPFAPSSASEYGGKIKIPKQKLKIAPLPPPPPPTTPASASLDSKMNIFASSAFSSTVKANFNSTAEKSISSSSNVSQSDQQQQPSQRQQQQQPPGFYQHSQPDEEMKLSPPFVQSPSSSHSFQSPPTSTSSFSPQPVLNPQPPPVKIVLKLGQIKQVCNLFLNQQDRIHGRYYS